MDKNVQYILEVARCGGITKAANKLYITPSALSKFVQAREKEMNVLLFHRAGKQFIPTAAGEYYIRKCEEIEKLQTELELELSRFSSLSHKIVRIGVQPSFANILLSAVIPEFKKLYPGIQIILREHSAGELMAMLKQQQVDVVLATEDKRESEFEYRLVKQCETVMAVRKNHPLMACTENRENFRYPWIDLAYCAQEENVMLLPDSLFRQQADAMYEKLRLKPNIVYQISGTRTGLACVAYNDAVMITMDHMIFNNMLAEQIIPLSIGEKPVYHELNLISMKDSVLQMEIGKLYEISCSYIQ